MKGNNPIQERIYHLLQKWTIAINTPGVKIVRILSAHDEQDMIQAFFEYMLAIDTDQEDFVLILERPFSNLQDFSRDLLEEIEEEINMWNSAEVPEELHFKTIEWKPDYSLANKNNSAALLIKNLNNFANYLIPEKDIVVSIVIRMHYANSKEAYKWLSNALEIPIEDHVVIGINDSEKFRIFDQLAKDYPTEVYTLLPDLDMDAAVEQLSAAGNPNEPATPYRTHLIKLMNGVKNREKEKIQKHAEACLKIATKELKKDPNWLSQIVTVYTILYSDQIGYKKYDDAIYFAGKAIEAAILTKDVLDPFMAYRLIGQTHIGRGSLFSLKKKRDKALDDYQSAAEAYERCNDHLMLCESLRLCGWMCEKRYEHKEATQYYIKAYQLKDQLTPDVMRSSTFPYVVKKLLNSSSRKKVISNKQMDKDLAPVFGENWEDTIHQYGKKPENQPEIEQTL
ncbi:hypothetical protein GCM10022393_20760 [Aquimarina addita]|uniref:Tetratricopeptide repeat protein n=1 Tax=Aquimarina addita TaxID=870485 RepID=A0ABP6UMI5_9FLAO